jgi:hypothetical protein
MERTPDGKTIDQDKQRLVDLTSLAAGLGTVHADIPDPDVSWASCLHPCRACLLYCSLHCHFSCPNRAARV